jgi:hypothetical protein
LIVPVLASIAAIILGFLGRSAVREGTADNSGMSLAGLILGWIGVALVVVSVAVIVGVLAWAANESNYSSYSMALLWV